MPYGIRKLPNKSNNPGKILYRVFNKKTRKIYSKGTTKTNAIKQIRLLRMITHKKHR